MCQARELSVHSHPFLFSSCLWLHPPVTFQFLNPGVSRIRPAWPSFVKLRPGFSARPVQDPEGQVIAPGPRPPALCQGVEPTQGGSVQVWCAWGPLRSADLWLVPEPESCRKGGQEKEESCLSLSSGFPRLRFKFWKVTESSKKGLFYFSLCTRLTWGEARERT